MATKKIKPPLFVPINEELIPPHWREKFDAAVHSKACPMGFIKTVMGERLSVFNHFTHNEENAEWACQAAWDHLIHGIVKSHKGYWKSIGEKTVEERKIREAQWAEDRKKQERERAIRKAQAEGKMNKKISRRNEIKWVDDRLGDPNVKPEDAPTPWCYNSWLDYHGTAENRDVFRKTFSVKVIETDKSAENENRRASKSDKTIELLDSILENHIEQSEAATDDEAGTETAGVGGDE